MKKYLVFIYFFTNFSLAQSSIWDVINKEFENESKKEVVEDINCNSGYSLNGKCVDVIKINLNDLNSRVGIKSYDETLEIEEKRLDNILENFRELMGSHDPKLKELQESFKSFGVDYEKILSLVFSYYAKNIAIFLEQNGSAKSVVNSFMENCNEQDLKNIEMLKFFLINDLERVLILTL